MKTNNTIALIGKPNVGKSTLFNRIIGKRKSIVHDEPGVTRDRLYHKASWTNHHFYIIDTGGIHIQNAVFQKEILAQAQIAINDAAVIIFVCDARSEISSDDIFIINLLRKSGKKIILALNKMEDENNLDYSWYGLGIEDVFKISALHGQGIGDMLDLACSFLSNKKDEEDNEFKLAILGKPNTGKSTLFNLLSQKERSIVSDVAGTTRDSVEETIVINKQKYQIIDTAGLIKKSKLVESVDHYAWLRAQDSLEDSNLSIIVLDATQELSNFDSRIIGYALENQKPIIIVINKWDLIEKDTNTLRDFEKKVRNKIHFVPWVPIVFISAKENKNVNKLIEKLHQVRTNLTQEIAPRILTSLMVEMQVFRQPKAFQGGVLSISLVKQIKANIPTFNFYVNNKKYLHFTYERSIENELRNSINLEGCPIKLNFIDKK
ncbi:GTP-binding protein EngA [Mycoplasmopsis californica]|uniref:GTPase Der n=1 Tax=Mycoplasmopsis equigenitalium TaxID=114883 RepID=A0ABY5J1T0_9BACT|nr:ribosome biogenesis GTPase Der [Mycoplasmopsis equigenitalium]UUD37205.1 ribosome biogenesis GTPase Der [Mycoplasmopsis equigenitalium]VEU69491.1 GTP-binding protein EngA [Mycoplasmopsis californica]